MLKTDFHYIENKSEVNEEIDYMRDTMLFSLQKSQTFTNLVQSLFMY